jgi:hypothetical protein
VFCSSCGLARWRTGGIGRRSIIEVVAYVL